MDQSTIQFWFEEEVLRWRTGAAITWSVLSVPVIGLVYVMLSCLQIFQPFSWLYNILTAPLSFSFISMMFIAMVVQVVYLVYGSRTYTVIPSVNVMRLSNLSQLLKRSCLAYTALCFTCGCIMGWVCTNLVGGRYQSLSYRCDEHSAVYCINEYHLFLVLYGGYTGFMYVIYHYIRQNNLLHFPTLQQAKYFQICCHVFKVAWKSLGFIIWQFKYYYLLYYFFGNVPRDWIANTLNLKFGTSYKLDSLYGLLLDVQLLWQMLVLGLFVQFTWSFSGLLYNVYITESGLPTTIHNYVLSQHYEFLVSSMFENYKNKCLVDAMSCINNRLIQAMGFYDLKLLSNYSYTRRKELFSLSQPGGHPHNWTKIVSVCLAVINELNDSVKETNWKILASAPVRHPSTEKSHPQDIHSISTSKPSMNGTTDEAADNKKQVSTSLKQKVMNSLKTKELLQFFMSEAPEAKTKNLFSAAFLQVWAVEALASLVSASFKEDNYGVVQMSLKEIVIAILALQENVEKHFKLTGGISRRVPKDQSTNETPWKNLLHTTLKNSTYEIVNTFGKHLLEIGFPSDIEKKIHHFLEYRE